MAEQVGVQTEAKGKAAQAADVVRTDIVAVLQGIRAGGCLFDLSESMERLVALIRERKKGGKLTLEISIDCMNAGDPSTLTLEDKVKIKEPTAGTKGKSIFFSTSRNTLQRTDPRQMQFDMTTDPQE